MKTLYGLLISLITFWMGFNFSALAQGGHHQGGYFDPDSLTLVTVSGTVIVESTPMLQSMYYLDENDDGQLDYHLNFGPYWYQPENSNVLPPQDGEVITVTGGLHERPSGDLQTIVVYEINGEFWREPFEAFWNNLGDHSHPGGYHQGDCQGYAFGWMHELLQTVSLSGVALVDTTFIMAHYYLDTDDDSMPDYLLNFGPPWYEPASGATRPLHGEAISISGGLLDHFTIPMIIVYEMNGLVWRDISDSGNHFGGRWIHRHMSEPQRIRTPFDPQDWLELTPGWHHSGGGHHEGMPDSLFCQLLEVFPQNIPHRGEQTVMAGYEIGIFSPDGSNNMWEDGGCGGHMNFNSTTNFQLHYNDVQLLGHHIDENSIRVKYWDAHSSGWIEAGNLVVDPVNNTVSFSQNQVSNFLILTGTQSPVAIGDVDNPLASAFVLKQNYPNPFNPGTVIEFELEKSAPVVLTIYNALGQKLFDLVNGQMVSGTHKVYFDGKLLPSGIYFYELKAGDQRQVMKMHLIR